MHELATLVPAASNAAHYARIVSEMATLRGLIRADNDIARLGFDRPGETVKLVDKAESIVFNLSQSRVSSEFAHIDDLLKDSFETITKLYEAGSDITGTPAGFRDLDRLTSGFQPGNLVIVAARPSMGKSALALCMASNVAVRHEIPVALFTLEMSKAEVTQRLMCAEGKVESQRLRTGKLAVDDWPRLTAACDKLAKAPIYVDDTGSITMMEIRSKLRRLKMKEPKLGLVIVDYLQLMTSGTSAENRVQEVSQISRALKVLARDLEVPIIALSQLSRAVEQRHDKRPILSDLRESGSIEQDADLVMFVYRDEYYNPEETESAGVAELLLAKHRNGATGVEKLAFQKRYAKFAGPGGGLVTTVWIAPSATSYSCLCETCLEAARTSVRSSRTRCSRRASPATCRATSPASRSAAPPAIHCCCAGASVHLRSRVTTRGSCSSGERAAARLAGAGGDDLRRALRGVPVAARVARRRVARRPRDAAPGRRRRLHHVPARPSHRHASHRPPARGRLARRCPTLHDVGSLVEARRRESRQPGPLDWRRALDRDRRGAVG